MFKRIWEWWKRTARKIGDFQARLLLILFYFLILAPFALLVWASDPLEMKHKAINRWRPRAPEKGDPMERAIRQW
jgi:hypothetical protein